MRSSHPIAFPATSALFGPISPNGEVIITGITVLESSGSGPIAVVIREGSSTGRIVAALGVASSGADTGHMEPVACLKQMYCQFIGAGTAAGSVHVK